MTREECGGGKVEPYYNSVRAGSFETSTGSVILPKDKIPVVPLIILTGVLLVAGGAYRKWG
jgi:hypothetical protein